MEYNHVLQEERKVPQKTVYNMQKTVCKTVHQYNQWPISDADMRKLQEIAEDYRKVKNYVYARYGGTGSLSKLYPGYTVQNEMTECGLRAELGMPSVYFYLAVFDALGDIKSQWAHTKSKVLKLTGQNESLNAEEKHYLRFVLKSSNAFAAVLMQKAVQLPHEIQSKYEELAGQVDTAKLHRYLCRQARKYHVRDLHTDAAEGFFVTERAYRYGEGSIGGSGEKTRGIFISTKENRKRVFIPLTDENAYKKQLYVKLKPEESGVEIHVPIEVKIRAHKDYCNEIGISAGIEHMFTTDSGHVYGERFGELHRELTEYMSNADRSYRREKHNNAGRKKYRARKARLDAALETYVNQEINRMLAEEKPQTIYIPRLPGGAASAYGSAINYSVNMWKKGYIRKRLEQKCRENAVRLTEVFGKGISTTCSRCGGTGKYSKDIFQCENCGYEADKKINTAQNALKRGKDGQQITFI